MFDVVAAVNDEEILENNLMRSPLFGRGRVTLHLQRGYRGAALAYHSAMGHCRSDVLVFVHQDVYLPGGWEDRLLWNIGHLAKTDPDWAVLGIYGVKPDGAQIGCVWSSGLDSMFGVPFAEPARVESIDEVLIVLRRSSGIEFDPELPGYHLYGTDLVQTALSRGKGAYVISAPVVHNSRPSLYLGQDYFRAYDYMARKWKHRLPIPNHIARVMRPGLGYLRMRIRHKFNEMRYSHLDRRSLDRNYDCVTLAHRLGFE